VLVLVREVSQGVSQENFLGSFFKTAVVTHQNLRGAAVTFRPMEPTKGGLAEYSSLTLV
jgi:hypothetical protein